MLAQRTLKSLTKAVGVGLHSGQRVELTLRPAQPDTGIVFRRVDLPSRWTSRSRPGGDRHAPGVDHFQRRRQGAHGRTPDVGLRRPGHRQPVRRHHGRGSADPRRLGSSFVFLLQSAGIELQNAPRRFIRVLGRWRCAKARARTSSGRGWIRTTATSWASRSTSTTAWSTPPASAYEFDLSSGHYSRDIARARTFGFTKDVEMMRANGLALGGGMDNAIVMDDYRGAQQDGLRYDDEFVKHKILDAMGDLYLVGKPLLAAYSAFRSGHALNNKLLRALLRTRMPSRS
jgi:UDP-3-O-[3-hydroxymyristoyl] N-acetylglucosamine deacetylase